MTGQTHDKYELLVTFLVPLSLFPFSPVFTYYCSIYNGVSFKTPIALSASFPLKMAPAFMNTSNHYSQLSAK